MARLKGKYPKASAGEWIKPRRRFYYMGCCDCGLVHKMEFALRPVTSGSGIFIRAWRDEAQTKALRKKERIRVRRGR